MAAQPQPDNVNRLAKLMDLSSPAHSEELKLGNVQDFCISARWLAKRLVTVVAGHDEHLHITASEHFCVLGGHAHAHAHVVSMVLKVVQDLETQGYSLEEASPEVLEMALQKICFQSSL